jgi:hypothetical protein
MEVHSIDTPDDVDPKDLAALIREIGTEAQIAIMYAHVKLPESPIRLGDLQSLAKSSVRNQTYLLPTNIGPVYIWFRSPRAMRIVPFLLAPSLLTLDKPAVFLLEVILAVWPGLIGAYRVYCLWHSLPFAAVVIRGHQQTYQVKIQHAPRPRSVDEQDLIQAAAKSNCLLVIHRAPGANKTTYACIAIPDAAKLTKARARLDVRAAVLPSPDPEESTVQLRALPNWELSSGAWSLVAKMLHCPRAYDQKTPSPKDTTPEERERAAEALIRAGVWDQAEEPSASF